MAVVNERARLPCDVTSVVADDKVVLILWYRGTTGTPIYRYVVLVMVTGSWG